MKRIAILGGAAITVFLVAYGAITFYDYNMKIGRMWETPAVRPHEVPILAMDKNTVPVGGGEAAVRLVPVQRLVSPLSGADPAAVNQAGQVLYRTYCIHCHGKYHDGNATVGQSFAPLPGDLRSARVQRMPEGQIFSEISFGVAGKRQPPLATTIEATDRWRIVAYVKSLGIR
ncbi:MAG: c-type cytochrome [Desulfobacterales bacterium]|nr:c-type cytochrome [Desulfobacterales bacterium]